jgi:hypothetical protein
MSTIHAFDTSFQGPAARPGSSPAQKKAGATGATGGPVGRKESQGQEGRLSPDKEKKITGQTLSFLRIKQKKRPICFIFNGLAE